MRFIVGTFILLIVLMSCKDDTEISYDVKRNNIVGEWNAVEIHHHNKSDTMILSDSINFVISFDSDGTGTQHGQFGLGRSSDFIWLYQYQPEQVAIDFISQFKNTQTQFYDVIKNEAYRQIWEFYDVNKNAQISKYRYTWKMTRK